MIKIENRNQFILDWIRIAGEYAKNHLGMDIPPDSAGASDQLLAQNFERMPKICRREIKLADNFKCPAELQFGWKFLQEKIKSGADLYPHLSRQIKKIDALDPLLMHWSINHFHLGTTPDPKHKGLVRGGKEIVYAYLDDHAFYAIAIFPHGHWEDINLIETIKRNWPKHPNLNTEMVFETSHALEDVLKLRAAQINAPTSLSDESSYMGTGITLAGTSAAASMKANGVRRIFRLYQFDFEKNFSRSRC